MNSNLTTNSVSIVLDKIDIQDLDMKLLKSYDENSSNYDNGNTDEQNTIDDNQNRYIINDLSGLDLSNVNTELQVKPLHWTEEYWQEILKKYQWFLHKDNYIGCKICYNIKQFMGKRSLLGTIKLFLMDLSYDELELKLATHNACAQHNKSIILYRVQIGQQNIDTVNLQSIQSFNTNLKSDKVTSIIRKSRSVDHYCPLCQKGYKLKKALAKHIYSCNNEQNPHGFNLSCECEDVKIASIRGIDEHNISMHSNNLLYVCKFCSSEFKQTTVLFGHLLLFHDFYWNPYEEMPNIIKTSILKNEEKIISNRPERKKSIANALSDNIYIMYGSKENNISFSKTKDIPLKRHYKKRQFKEPTSTTATADTPVSDIRIERVMNEANNQEISKLTISQSSILTCEYCGGRYVSASILNAHMANYHSIIPQIVQEDEEKRRMKCIKRLNKIVNNPASLNFQMKKSTKSAYIRLSTHMRKLRALQMKKKHNLSDNTAKIKQLDIKSLLAKRNKVSASMLTCPACHLSFENLDMRYDHVSMQHPELEKFSCKICGLIFTNQKNYRQHLEKSHNNSPLPKQIKPAPEKTYSCENCHLVFTNQADLTRHSNFSHPELQEKQKNNPVETVLQTCDLDEQIPTTLKIDNELDALIMTDSMENLSHCSNCDLELNNPFELLVHSLTHNENGKQNEEFQSCPNCSRLFFGQNRKIYLKDHYNSEHLKKPLPTCSVCKMDFTSSFILDKHQIDGVCQNISIDDPYSSLMAVDKLSFSCSQCGLIYAGQNSKQRFDIHMDKCTFELMDNELLNS